MSASEKKHDYHLVDPSPWPIFCSIASLILAVGAVYYFRTKNLWLVFIGLAVLLYGMFMWFRDVVIEAEHKGDHTPVVQLSHRYGMTLFIASEVMFFVAWFWAYFDASLFPDQIIGGVWPPKGIQTLDPWHIPLINTLILLLSGTTVTWAHHALLENDRKSLIQGLVLTVILGSIFTMFPSVRVHARNI
jgi:cytochrome c oxidase subunit III